MNPIIKRTLGALLALQATNVLAGSGNLFNVTTSGAALGQTVSYTLCLTINGKNPLSCQNYSTSTATLTIKTTASHHTYHYAGIKINTLGYVYTAQGLRRSVSKQGLTAAGYTGIGTVSDTQSVSGTVTSTTATTYSGIYVFTENFRTTYSTDNGTSWASMLSQQSGFWNQQTSAFAVTTNGTMYMATGVVGTAGTLLYTSDGISWSQINSALPVTGDWVQSVFAAGNTVYVGTGDGYVYSTTGNGVTWTQLASPVQLESSAINAVFVDSSGNYYAGTANGNVYISGNSGASWTATSQPDSSAVESLAVSANGNLYAVTSDTENNNTPPYYSPNQGAAWTAMGVSAGNTASAISVLDNTVYIGTNVGNLQYTTDNGANWTTANTQPDGSKIDYLFINQNNNLSPLFVESYGAIPINNSESDCAATGAACTVTVKNLSSTTANNVQADPTQLPLGVTQTPTSCASVASGGTCSITFSASGTGGFSPTAFNIVDGNGNTISRSALVSAVNTPAGGTGYYYYVYATNGTTAYVVDSSTPSGGTTSQVWSQTNVDILGITENDTGGATDGSANSNTIVTYYGMPYTNYAAGICYQNTNPNAKTITPGTWYLPATCELNGSVYLNTTTNNFSSCSPAVTSIFSLYSLGALGAPLSGLLSAGLYWSSTEVSVGPQGLAWGQYLGTGGGGGQDFNGKAVQNAVRCSQALTI